MQVNASLMVTGRLHQRPCSLLVSCVIPPRPSRRSLELGPPIDIVSLDLTCSAYNGHMTLLSGLLPLYQKRTRYNLTDQFRLFIQNYNFGLISVWKTFYNKLKCLTLISEIKINPLDLEPMPANPPFLTYMIDAIGLGIFLALIFIFRSRLQNCMSKFKICKWSVKRGTKGGQWTSNTKQEPH